MCSINVETRMKSSTVFSCLAAPRREQFRALRHSHSLKRCRDSTCLNRRYVSNITVQEFEQDKSYYSNLVSGKPLHVKMVEGKGRGLFATRNIQAGEVFVTEKAMSTALASHADTAEYCWNCFAPLYDPVLFGEDDATQGLIDSGKISASDHEIQYQMLHVFDSLGIPNLSSKDFSTTSKENNVRFCCPACARQAAKTQGVLLKALEKNTDEIKAAKALPEGAARTFRLLSRFLALASSDPNLVFNTMSKFVTPSNIQEKTPDTPTETHKLLLSLFPDHKNWFTTEVFSRLVGMFDLNSMTYAIFPVSLAIQVDSSSQSGYRFRVSPVFTDKKIVRATSIFALSSLFNHSCDANIVVRAPFNHNLHWMASKDIFAGEELTMSYLGYDVMSKEERQRALLEKYEFECHCPKCSAEK